MTTKTWTTYGEGGYDPSKPNDNVIDSGEYEVPPEVENEDTVRDRADQALAGLRTIAGSSGALTNEQLSNAVRLLARVAIALVRLALRKLDATD